MTVSDPPFKVPDAGSTPAPAPEPERVEQPEQLSLDPDENAPLGYVIDRATGERRPKKKAGRPTKASAPRAEPRQDTDRPPDLVPGRIKPESKARRGRPPREQAPEEPIAPFRAGPIAKGINRLYRKAGKILSVWDREIGRAVIECTRKDTDPDTGEPDPEDTTVGEAWEEIARVYPRIRRVLLKLIEGGAWGQLLMAHAPILLAILMKESIIKHLPMGRLLAAFVDDSEDGDDWAPEAGGQPDVAGMFASLTQEDLAQAAAVFSQFGQGGQLFDIPAMNHRPPVVDDFGSAGE